MANNRKIILSVFVLSVLAIGAILFWQKESVLIQQSNGIASPRNKVFDLTLENYEGETIKLADFLGKSLVINSWAAWCPFCKKELVDFVAAQKEFENQITIIAIDRAESLETAKKYSDELGVTNNLVFLLDPSDSFYQSIGGFSMPETIFVDQNGKIKIHKRGPMDFDEIKEKIQQLLLST